MIKYLFSTIITILTYKTTGQLKYIWIGLVELALLVCLTDRIGRRNRRVSYVINAALSLLYNAQMLVLYFAGSYIQLVMLSNISSLDDLSGKTLEYGLGAVLTIVFSLLPTKPFPYEKIRKIKSCSLENIGKLCRKFFIVEGMLIFGEIILIVFFGSSASPILSYGDIVSQTYRLRQIRQSIETDNFSYDNLLNVGIEDYRAKDIQLSENTNVILIFAEGLSQNIVDDERNIMPNLAYIQENSLNFTGYYNHTFATYRGLIGQLYSGYQLDNFDENKLVSIQSVLKDEGYYTTSP